MYLSPLLIFTCPSLSHTHKHAEGDLCLPCVGHDGGHNGLFLNRYHDMKESFLHRCVFFLASKRLTPSCLPLMNVFRSKEQFLCTSEVSLSDKRNGTFQTRKICSFLSQTCIHYGYACESMQRHKAC